MIDLEGGKREKRGEAMEVESDAVMVSTRSWEDVMAIDKGRGRERDKRERDDDD